MASVGAKSVGRVSIRVIPDSSQFRADLQKVLTRMERTMRLSVPVEADTAGARVSLNRLAKDFDGRNIALKAELDSAVASARIAAVSRPRSVELLVSVSKASMARAGTLLAAFSGARVAGNMVKSLTRSLGNLDQALPRLAVAATSIAALSAVGLSSVGGLLTVGAGLASIAGAALALPGIMAGAAIGVGVLAVALGTATTELASLKPALTGVRDLIRENFWAQARQPILDLANGLLPQLESGLGRTASALGTWSASVASGFSSAFGGGALERMINQLNDSILIAAGGTGAFANAMSTLGTVGSSYLPRLATWVRDITVAFDGWLTRMNDSGRLTGFIDAGIVALGQLGQSIGYIGGILSGLTNAAQAAGGGGLQTLADNLYAVSMAVNSAPFQTALTALFSGAAAGAAGLAAALGPIGDMLSALAPTLQQILASSGQVLGQLFGAIATALSTPEFSAGLGLFFSGILSGLQAIMPALPALSSAFATFLGFAGQLASVLGPVLGTVLTTLAPVFSELLVAISPLLPVLGQALIGAFTSLAPVLVQLVQTLLPPLVQMIMALLPVLLPLVQAVLPVVSALLPVVAQVLSALAPVLVPILSALAPIVNLLGMVLIPVLQVLTPLIQLFGAISAQAFSFIGAVVQSVVLLIVGLLSGNLSGALGQIGAVWSSAWQGMQDAVKAAWDGIRGFINGMLGVIESGVNNIIGLINGFTAGLSGAISGVASLLGVKGSVSIGVIPKLSIPRLALGADILPTPGGVLTILGEGGQRERVIEAGLGNRALALQNAATERVLQLAGNGGQTFYVQPPPDQNPAVVARVWAREFGRSS